MDFVMKEKIAMMGTWEVEMDAVLTVNASFVEIEFVNHF